LKFLYIYAVKCKQNLKIYTKGLIFVKKIKISLQSESK
jgi:hypothetical protein